MFGKTLDRLWRRLTDAEERQQREQRVDQMIVERLGTTPKAFRTILTVIVAAIAAIISLRLMAMGQFIFLGVLVVGGLIIAKRYRDARWALVGLAALGLLGFSGWDTFQLAFGATVVVTGLAVAAWTRPTTSLLAIGGLLIAAVLVFGARFHLSGTPLVAYVLVVALMGMALLVLAAFCTTRDVVIGGIFLAVVLMEVLVFNLADQRYLFDSLQTGGSGDLNDPRGWVFRADYLFNPLVLLALAFFAPWQVAAETEEPSEEEPTEPTEADELMEELYEHDKGKQAVVMPDLSGWVPAVLKTLDIGVDELNRAGVTPVSYAEYAINHAIGEAWVAALPRRNGVIPRKKLENQKESGFRTDFFEGYGVTDEILRNGKPEPKLEPATATT